MLGDGRKGRNSEREERRAETRSGTPFGIGRTGGRSVTRAGPIGNEANAVRVGGVQPQAVLMGTDGLRRGNYFASRNESSWSPQTHALCGSYHGYGGHRGLPHCVT